MNTRPTLLVLLAGITAFAAAAYAPRDNWIVQQFEEATGLE